MSESPSDKFKDASAAVSSPAFRTIVALAAFVIVTAGLNAASDLLVPFLLAGFFAIILSPLLLGLQRLGVGTPLAILFMVVVLVFVGWISGSLLASGVARVTNKENLRQIEDRVRDEEKRVIDWLKKRGLYELPVDNLVEVGLGNGDDTEPDAAPDIEATDADTPPLPAPATVPTTAPAAGSAAAEPRGPSFIENLIDPKQLPTMIENVAGAASKLLTQSFIILVLVIFIMLEAAGMPRKVRNLPGLTDAGWERAQRIIREIRRYMALKTVMSLLTGALVFVWLTLIGVPYAILFGFLAFVLNYVPNIGSTIAALPPVLISLLDDGAGWAVANALGFIAINVGVSNGIEPRFMGRGLDLSPLVILISLFFWGWVLGPMGMLLSVPLTMTLKIVLESGEDTRWIALLLGGAPRGDTPPANTPPAPPSPAPSPSSPPSASA